MTTIHDAIAIAITADGTRAKAEFAAVGKSAKTHLDGAQKSSAGLSSTLTKVGVGAAVAGAAIGAGLFKAADAASRAQIEHDKLLNTIQRSPQLVGASVAAFERQQRAIQNTTVVDDEAAAGLQSLLGNFKLTQSQILQLTPLVVDLSRKFGVDLASAGTAVGKAFATGESRGLKPFGITAKLVADPTERLAQLTDLLGKKAGGFAATEGKSFSGQLQIAKNKMGDLEEAIGAGALPVISKLADIAGGVADKFTSLNDATGGATGEFLAYGAAALIATGSLSVIIGQLGKLKEAYQAVKASSALGGIGAGAGVFGAIAVGAVVAAEAVDEFSAQSVLGFKRAVQDASAAADKFRSAIEGDAQVFDDSLAPAVAKFVADNGDIDRALKKAGLSAGDLERAVRDLALAGGDQNKVSDETKRVLDAVSKSGTKNFGALAALASGYADAREKNERYNSALKETKDEQDRGDPAAQRHVKALQEDAKAAKDASAHLYDLVHATQDVHNAQRDASEVGLDYADAIQTVKDRQADLQQLEKDGKKGTDEYAKAQRELQRAVNDVGGVIDDGKSKIVDAAKAAAGGATNTLAYRDSLAQAAKSLEPGSPLRVWLDALIKKFDDLNGRRIAVTIEARYEDKGFVVGGSGGGVKRYAKGGWVDAPKGAAVPAIVHGGEYVLSADMLAGRQPAAGLRGRRSGGIGGGDSHHYTIHVASLDPRQSKDLVLAALLEAQRVKGTLPLKVA